MLEALDCLQQLLQPLLHTRYAKRSVTVHAPTDAALLAAICGSPSSVVHSWAFSPFAANQLPVLSLSLSRAGGDGELTWPRAPPRRGEGGADQSDTPSHTATGTAAANLVAGVAQPRRRTSWRGRTARPQPRRWRREAEQRREARRGGWIRHGLATRGGGSLGRGRAPVTTRPGKYRTIA
jgi:hypothetical protein